MKKAITFRLCVVIITAMVMTALLGYYLQTKSAKEAMRTGESEGGLFHPGKSGGVYRTEPAGRGERLRGNAKDRLTAPG